MPAVHAVGITTDRPPPFHLPVLDNRGDIAARLAAIMTDDADGLALPEDTPLGTASVARANADGLANRARAPETVSRARTGSSAGAHRGAARVRPVETSAVGTSAAGGTSEVGTSAVGNGGDGARVRAAAAVPARARMVRPDGAPATAPVSYTADDWRGRIKGAPARADAHVYGAPGGQTSAGPGADPGAVSVPAARAGDATTPVFANSKRATAAPAGRGKATESAQATGTAKPISMLDRAARIGLLGALLAIFVVLFIFGPRISQWWGRL